MKDRLPKGFVCTKCSKPHVFHAYVFAHWNDALVHKCECNRQHQVIRGTVFTYRVKTRAVADKFFDDGEVKHEIQDPQ